MTAISKNVLVMGVCGVGKSTIARRLADAYGGHFLEGDSYHPGENIASMSRGIPLTDQQRWEWLHHIADAIRELDAKDTSPVFLACSALKRSYRELLRDKIGPLAIVHLHGDPAIIRERMNTRTDHFMPPALLASQFRDLEEPDPNDEPPMVQIDIANEVDVVTREAIQFCRRHVAGAGASRHGTPSPRQQTS